MTASELRRSSSWLGSRLPAMVFSMAAMPSSVGSAAMRANCWSKLSQGRISTCSPGKLHRAAVSWKHPGCPCMVMRFIIEF